MEPSEARDWGRGLAAMGQVRQWEWLGVLPSTAEGQGTGEGVGGRDVPGDAAGQGQGMGLHFLLRTWWPQLRK